MIGVVSLSKATFACYGCLQIFFCLAGNRFFVNENLLKWSIFGLLRNL